MKFFSKLFGSKKNDNHVSDHDPFNEPDLAHPRARELMREEYFWDCTDESAPFGSDEGSDAYYEWRQWRQDNPKEGLVKCFSWILSGRLNEYNDKLVTDEVIEQDIVNPDDAFLSEGFDIFTLDTTIISTALGQLIDEGVIDSDAKQYVMVAIKRQSHPKICKDNQRLSIMKAAMRVVDAA